MLERGAVFGADDRQDEKEWMESERDYELNVEKADVTITLATDVKAIMKARRAKR